VYRQAELERPGRLARAVVFLAGKGSAFINGIELFVDGGVTQN